MEREIKLRILGDARVVEDYLVEHGFRIVDECIERDVYFKHPCRDLALTDEAIRFRYRACRSGRYTLLTYKGPRVEKSSLVKTRLEVEVYLPLNQASKLLSLLEHIGVTPLTAFTKKRRLYRGEGMTAYIDELVGVGLFLEVELEDAVPTVSLSSIVNRLSGIVEPVEKTYLEICLETGRCVDQPVE